MNIKEVLQDIYLEYVNGHLTVRGMAEYHGLNKDDLNKLLDMGEQIAKGCYRTEDN
jgi:hypothetical protein